MGTECYSSILQLGVLVTVPTAAAAVTEMITSLLRMASYLVSSLCCPVFIVLSVVPCVYLTSQVRYASEILVCLSCLATIVYKIQEFYTRGGTTVIKNCVSIHEFVT